MTTIVDTSALVAFYDSDSSDHSRVVAAFGSAEGPLVVPPLVLAEFDFMATKYLGEPVAIAALRELAAVASIAVLDNEGLRQATNVQERYADLRLGLTDATVVVAAAAHHTAVVLTLDRRHLGTVRPLQDVPAFDVRP